MCVCVCVCVCGCVRACVCVCVQIGLFQTREATPCSPSYSARTAGRFVPLGEYCGAAGGQLGRGEPQGRAGGSWRTGCVKRDWRRYQHLVCVKRSDDDDDDDDDGFFLACEDFGRMFNRSSPAFFFFFFKWILARAN